MGRRRRRGEESQLQQSGLVSEEEEKVGEGHVWYWDWLKTTAAIEVKTTICGKLMEGLCMGAVVEDFEKI